MFFEEGKTEKIKIIPYLDDTYSEDQRPSGNPEFVLQVNPETIKRRYSLEYDEQKDAPSGAHTAKYFKTAPEDFNIDVLFDATGAVKDAGLFNIAIPNPFATQDNDLTTQIENFKNYFYYISSDKHRPYFMKVVYGSVEFKGVLKSLDLDYKLFSSQGLPLRVLAHLTLTSAQNPTEGAAEASLESADITHQRTFEAGTHFTILCNKIYDDVNRYIDVAQVNSLLSFRKIETGTVISFPPIK